MGSKIVIVRNSESLPNDVSGGRFWRSGLYVKWLFNRGHDVRWMISSFDHYNQRNRRQILPFDNESELHKTVEMISTCGYTKNVSVKRLWDHFSFGVKVFFKLCLNEKPDVIVCSFPTPESSFFVSLYGRLFGVPVVLDIRDKWPDVFLETQRHSLKKLVVSGMLLPYFVMKKLSMKMATSLVAANPDFLNWGISAAGRAKSEKDFVSFIPFEIPKTQQKNFDESGLIFQRANVADGELVITFAGTLGQMFSFEALKSVVYRCRSDQLALKFILCGQGSSLERLKKEFSDFPEVFFPGQVSASTVFCLLKRSDLLLAPYKEMDNFKNHLPNKFMEYCAAGRPILSSLSGYAKGIINDNRIGKTYTDEVSLYEAIVYYSSDSATLVEHSINAENLYKSVFHPSIILNDFEERLTRTVIKRS